MRLLDRYLLRELLAPLAYCLGGFLIFWISYDAFKNLPDFQDAKLHALDIAEYYVAVTPGFLVTVLPVGLLLALLYTLTSHARHNEITAMRAAGLSLWRIGLPYFLVGFAASLALFALNESCAPRGDAWADRIKNRYVQKTGDAATQNDFRKAAFANPREHRRWFIGDFRANTAQMFDPKVSWILPDGSLRLLSADRAWHSNGVWTFSGNVREYQQATSAADPVPMLVTNVLALPKLDETPAEIRDELRREMKINQYLNLTAKADFSLTDILRYLRFHPALSRADSSRLLTDLQGRLAAPWTCLVVVLIAIPFGAAPGRRNLFVGVAGSIFICFGYFVIQQVSLAFGSGGHWPPWLAAWLPNLAFGAGGLILTARVR
ncbi:MAG: LptF/LptG family permease [Verrucomicrobiota bacterium]|nr:LptF/LptG family permease [Verrucomicrobiota bacterium]